MSSNLPPGVTENMIPGNRSEDKWYDDVFALIEHDLDDYSPFKRVHVDFLMYGGWEDGLSAVECADKINRYLNGEE